MAFEPKFTIEHNGEKFEFTNPSPRAFARIGARSALLRQQDGLAVEATLDTYTSNLYFGMALYETLLVGADAEGNWPYTPDAQGRPVVDADKFPPEKTSTVVEVGNKFYDMFFGQEKPKATDGQPVPDEGVGGGDVVQPAPVG